MPRHPVQQAYLDAQAEVERLNALVREQARPLDQQVERGEISEEAWALARDDLDQRSGWAAACQNREQAQVILLAWGLRQVRLLWSSYGSLFAGSSLVEIEAAFTRPRAWPRLIPAILRLNEWVDDE